MNVKALAAIGLMAVGVGAIGVTVLGVGSPSNSSVTYRTSQAATTTVQETAAASGSLVAATKYELAFGTEPVATSGTSSSSSSASAASTSGASSSTTSASSASASGAGSGTTSVSVVWPVTDVNVQVGDIVKAGAVLAAADDTTAELAVRQA